MVRGVVVLKLAMKSWRVTGLKTPNSIKKTYLVIIRLRLISDRRNRITFNLKDTHYNKYVNLNQSQKHEKENHLHIELQQIGAMISQR